MAARLAGGVVAGDGQLDPLADAHLADAVEAELPQRPGHGLALGVQDALPWASRVTITCVTRPPP